jgi:hypothetical protein
VVLPGLSLPARPGLLVFTTILLSLFGLILTIPGYSDSSAVAEFLLLSDPSFSNLNNTSAPAPAYPPAPQVATQQGSRKTTETGRPATGSADTPTEKPDGQVPEQLAMPTPEPVPLPPAEFPRRLAVEEALPILPATVQESAKANCYTVRDPYQGETPMMRTWKLLGLQTLLAALFAAAPSLGSNPSGAAADVEKLQEIQKQLEDLKRSVIALEERIKDVRTESTASGQRVQNQLKDLSKDLNEQMSLLRTDMESLRSRLPAATRVSAFPPSDTGPSPGTARVEMLNTYSQPVSIVVNNRRSYLLAPGERRLSDPISAGPFTYEVLGVQPVVTRSIAADKTFTVWVHPQP